MCLMELRKEASASDHARRVNRTIMLHKRACPKVVGTNCLGVFLIRPDDWKYFMNEKRKSFLKKDVRYE